ncbi:hypothetical protein HJFPF1_08433 [Paramyrothecium foliicola]|nr:hypothetical protein HJFPF1_08433 [Paramyrothecium foliicola]
MPSPTLGVDLRQYDDSTSCSSGHYFACLRIASGTCCASQRLQIQFRGFSCVGCASADTHALFNGPWDSPCATFARANTGEHPNCITTAPEEGRFLSGHRWCRNCAAREGRLVSRDTGEEVQCEKTVEPNVLVVDGDTFNITAMTDDELSEIAQVVRDPQQEIREVFQQYKIVG